MGLSNGVDRFDPVSHQATHYSLPGFASAEVTQLAVDRLNYLWVGTAGGVCRLDLRNRTRRVNLFSPVFAMSQDNPGSLASDYARVIFTDRAGEIWIGTENGGLDKFDYQTGSFFHCRSDSNDAASLNNDSIYSLFQDRTGTLWVGTFAGGVNVSRRNGDAILHFQTLPGHANSVGSNPITDFLEDKDGTIWICTDGGGSTEFDPRTRVFRHWTTRNSGLSRDAVLDVYEDGIDS